jgi:hypothetical protein
MLQKALNCPNCSMSNEKSAEAHHLGGAFQHNRSVEGCGQWRRGAPRLWGLGRRCGSSCSSSHSWAAQTYPYRVTCSLQSASCDTAPPAPRSRPPPHPALASRAGRGRRPARVSEARVPSGSTVVPGRTELLTAGNMAASEINVLWYLKLQQV